MTNTKKILDNAIIAYYGMSDPIMSDQEFDVLFEKEYGTETSPFEIYKKIFKGSNRKRSLGMPMLSLKKAKKARDIASWVSKITAAGATSIYLTPKFDGLACLIVTDENSTIISATTRGNGSIGEDITYVVSKIPLEEPLPANSSIQAELCVGKTSLESISKDMDTQYNAIRNTASGLVRTTGKKASIAAKHLSLYFHFNKDKYHSPEIPVTDTTDPEDIIAELTEYREYLENLDVLTDGAVIVATDEEGNPMRSLGDDGNTPRWSIAWKYDNIVQDATIVDIIWQLGKSKNTPVAIFSPPVYFDNTKVEKCTLHNMDYIKELDIHIGDTVSLAMANGVIPSVIGMSSIGENRVSTVEPDSLADTSSGYYSVLSAHMMKVLDIYGAGDVFIEELANYAYINHSDLGARAALIQSLHDLKTTPDLLRSEFSLGEKRSETMEKELDVKLPAASAQTWLACLGYNGIGRRMSKKLVSHSGTVQRILDDLDSPDNLKTKGVGDKVLAPLVDNKDEVRKIFSEIINPLFSPKDEDMSTSTADEKKKIVVTGTFDVPRKEIVSILEDHGYEMSSSVSGETFAVITPDASSGSSKLKKAEKLNVQIVESSDIAEAVKILG